MPSNPRCCSASKNSLQWTCASLSPTETPRPLVFPQRLTPIASGWPSLGPCPGLAPSRSGHPGTSPGIAPTPVAGTAPALHPASLAILETWVAEISVPHSCSVTRLTLRVETPLTYISAKASSRAFSDRHPRCKRLGIRRQVPHLGYFQLQLPHTGGDRLVLEAIGMIPAPGSPLVGFGSQKIRPLQFHGQIQQLLQNLPKGLGTFLPLTLPKSLVVNSLSGLGSSILLSKLVGFVLENPVPNPCPWRWPASTAVGPPGLPSSKPLLPRQNSNYRKKVTQLTGLPRQCRNA